MVVEGWSPKAIWRRMENDPKTMTRCSRWRGLTIGEAYTEADDVFLAAASGGEGELPRSIEMIGLCT